MLKWCTRAHRLKGMVLRSDAAKGAMRRLRRWPNGVIEYELKKDDEKWGLFAKYRSLAAGDAGVVRR